MDSHNVVGLTLASLALLVSGCDGNSEAACGAELSAKVGAVQGAAIDLAAKADQVRQDVLAACRAISMDLGADVPAQGEQTDDEYLTTVCEVASGAIDAEVTAGATISIAAQPPQCTIDASAQLDCEASCDVSGGCDPGTVEARCDPGELSVQCDGMCEVDAYCEAEAGASVECEGSCEGNCTGECSGSTNDAGECDGTCTGSCEGTCQVTASGGASCGADARCRGGCDGTATAPECHAELTPPDCDLDADCQAGCDSQAEFNAECTPGQVSIDVQGGANPMLATTLEANLPAILAVRDGVAGFLSGAGDVATAGANVVSAIASVPACVAAVGAELEAALSGAVEASASVTISVEASASVGGSASGG